MKFYGDYEVYSETGVDLTLLRANLKRTVEDRLKYNRHAVELAQELRKSRSGSISHQTREGTMADLNLSALLQQLVDHNVQFVVVGGLAMIAQGSAYITQDLDICYSRAPENLDALVTALVPLHPYLRGAPAELPFLFDAETLQAGLNFTLITDQGDLDLLGEVSGIGSYAQALVQSEQRIVFGCPIHVLSLDGLIAAKKAAGRPKDRTHLLELEALKELRGTQQ